jgi:hypothetical protein
VLSIGTAVQRALKFIAFDANGNLSLAQSLPSGTLSLGSILSFLGADPVSRQSPAEISAGVTPTDLRWGVDPYDIRRYGAVLDNVTDDTVALTKALRVGTQTVNGALGSSVSVPTGNSLLSTMVVLPNRVRILGSNKRGSYFLAKAGWSVGTAWSSATNYATNDLVTSGGNLYIAKQASTNQAPPSTNFWLLAAKAMFYANNGFTAGNGNSMFDSTLENVTVDANNTAGLGCVLSDAWQEDCGLRGVLLIQFATFGVKYQNGFGGASLSRIVDTEIFGGTTAGAVGIELGQMSVSGAVFLLDVQNTSITGGSVGLTKGINVVAENLHCNNVHFEVATHGVYLNGAGNHVLIGVTGATTVSNLVSIDPAFTGTVTMLGCSRNGTNNLINDGRSKQISLLGTITGGSGYVNGTYNSVPLTGGTGTNATAQVVVSGGAVSAVHIGNPGTNYAVGDVLSASASNIGGSGAGFTVPVTKIFTGVGVIAGRDYGFLQLGPDSSNADIGNAGGRSPYGIAAWGVFDGTVTGTNACAASQNVVSVQRTGVGRYLVTLANSLSGALSLVPLPTTANPILLATAGAAGAGSFTIAVNNSGTGAATDSNDIRFIVAGG